MPTGGSVLVIALETGDLGGGGWRGKKLPDASSAEGLPASVKSKEPEKLEGVGGLGEAL